MTLIRHAEPHDGDRKGSTSRGLERIYQIEFKSGKVYDIARGERHAMADRNRRNESVHRRYRPADAVAPHQNATEFVGARAIKWKNAIIEQLGFHI